MLLFPFFFPPFLCSGCVMLTKRVTGRYNKKAPADVYLVRLGQKETLVIENRYILGGGEGHVYLDI